MGHSWRTKSATFAALRADAAGNHRVRSRALSNDSRGDAGRRRFSDADVSEHDGLVVVHDDTVLAVPEHGAGQHGAFDVGADTHQIVNGVRVVDADNVLFDDRPLVENFGHVVGGGADQLDAAFACPLVGAAPVKAGRNE